jgi:hypothetical protein
MSRGRLESAFPVDAPWLAVEDGRGGREGAKTGGGGGVLGPEVEPARIDRAALCGHLDRLWEQLVGALGIEVRVTPDDLHRAGIATIRGGRIVPRAGSAAHGDTPRDRDPEIRQQGFELQLRSQQRGDATLLRCISPVGSLDLRDDRVVDDLYELQQDHAQVKICCRPEGRRRLESVTIEAGILFSPATTQVEEFRAIIERTVLAADAIENEMMAQDQDPDRWLKDELASGGTPDGDPDA